jgi:thioredoxin 1
VFEKLARAVKRGAFPMGGKSIIEISDSTFDQEVLQSDVPVLVDFWAPWCGPCRAIAPVIDELSGDYAGKLKVAKCNVDDNPKTPSRYGIRAIPTLIIFKDGNVSEQITGAVAKSQITAAVDKAVG